MPLDGTVSEVGNYLIGQPDARSKKLIALYNQAKQIRMPKEADWRRVAELALPREYGGWTKVGGPASATQGAATTARQVQFDSTLARSIAKFGAVCERMISPNGQTYHILRPSDPSMLRSRAVREYYDSYNELLFALRYNPFARFTSTQGQIYRGFASYGQAVKMLTWRGASLKGTVHVERSLYRGRGSRRPGGFLYRAIPFRNCYWLVDSEERICMFFRRIDWTASQAVDALKERTPKKVKEHYDRAGSADMTRTFEFVQIIAMADDYMQDAFDFRRFPWSSLYLYVEEPQIVVDPTGYYSFPVMIPRDYCEDGSPYAFGRAQQVLSTVGTVNAQVKTMLKVGQKKADPPLLARDDGILNGTVDITPAAVNYGGIDSNGREMIKPMQIGDVTLAEKLLEMQQADIKEPFFTTMFEMLKDRPQMTAAEVMQYAVDNATMLSPTMGQFQEGDQGPQIEREIELCEQFGWAPQKPAEVQENPEYDVIYTSPLAKMARGESVKGFVALMNITGEWFKLTQDPTAVRMLNFKEAMPEIAELNSVPARWINDLETVAAEEAVAEKDKQDQKLIDVAPAAASMMRSMSDNQLKGGSGQS